MQTAMGWENQGRSEIWSKLCPVNLKTFGLGGAVRCLQAAAFSPLYRCHHGEIIPPMEQVMTLVCKLQPTAEQAQHLDKTLTRFAEACAYSHTTLPANIRNKDRMQAMLYYDVRSRFQLSANLAIQAMRRVAMN